MRALLLALLLDFGNPTRVAIRGYDGDAMEPFLTRDGRILIFNNSNERPDETDIHWAERIDDVTFQYRGKLAGANSPSLDGVPTVDVNGNIFFVTLRSYAANLMTIYRGRFENGSVSSVAPVPGVSRNVPGQVNFDVEVSADGSTLYFVDGLFTGGPVPVTADLVMAVRGTDGVFRRVADDTFAAINTSALEYAAAISEDELELYFTRIVGGVPTIFGSRRSTQRSAWQTPQRIVAITGFVEAPTVAPGGVALLYHARRDGRFVIERVTPKTTGGRRRAVR